jgi:simple sugar transport system ATP-binding protein
VSLPRQIGFIPDDRGGKALIGSFNISENVALGLVGDSRFRWGPAMLWSKINQYVKDLIVRYGIRAESYQQKVDELSGGNQQKVVLARELKRSKDLLVARNPTQGLDVKGSEFFYQQMMELLVDGSRSESTGPRAGVVLISSDLEEILSFADEIYVIYNGELLKVNKADVSREFIGRLMLTGRRTDVLSVKSDHCYD